MYSYIKGVLAHCTTNYAIIETAGVGYKIFIPANVFAHFPPLGSELLLHISFIVREQSHALYGFMTIHERDLFETLMGVTGVGPKLALSLVGHLSLTDLQQALNFGNIHALSKVPGVGKKIAERLVVELKDRNFPQDPAHFAIPLPSSATQKINDAMSALINLGYHQNIAQKAIKKVMSETSEDIELASLITYALKII